MRDVPPPVRVLNRLTAADGEPQEEVACPLCRGTSATLELEARDLLYNKPNTYRLVRCNDCSLAFVNPRPTVEALGPHYPDDYHCYRPIEAAPAWLRPLARMEIAEAAKGRLRSIERVLGRLSPDIEIVDVGCGRNALLHHIREARGATGVGIEMKPEMVAYVREQLGMPVVEGMLLDAELESARFDLAVMMEYLEHEPDPMRVLAEARRILKPGGHLIIEIPDPEGAPARMFGKRWVNLDLPRHLVFFDRKTLSRALDESGFEVVSHRRFALPGYLGFSVLLGLGARNIMRHWNTAAITSYALGVPFLPAMPWLPEFSFVIAKAV